MNFPGPVSSFPCSGPEKSSVRSPSPSSYVFCSCCAPWLSWLQNHSPSHCLLSQPGAGRKEDAALAAPEVRLTTASPHQWSQLPLPGHSFCFLALDVSSFRLLWFSSFFALPPHPHFLGKEKKVSGLVSVCCFKTTACQFHVELLISVLEGKVSNCFEKLNSFA